VADLGRLTIVEKSYGYRLEAVRDEHGHADLATALAIALPIAVEQSGHEEIIITAGFGHGGDEYESPSAAFARRLADAWRRDAEEMAASREVNELDFLTPTFPGAPRQPRDGITIFQP
jgi:hypothetical protein